MKAIWKNTVIAESQNTIEVEGNQYFPPDSIKTEYLIASNTNSVCYWKGTASYYNIAVDGQVNNDAAWYYPNPSDRANNIVNHVAFWKGVEITN